jgi:hypothetical protein
MSTEVRATADERRSYGRFRVECAHDRAPRVPRGLQEASGGVPLLNLLKAHAVGHTWFSFLQGLEPSAVNPARIPAAAREDTQPV